MLQYCILEALLMETKLKYFLIFFSLLIQPADSKITVHSLKTCDGAILDLDDILNHVADDREQVILFVYSTCVAYLSNHWSFCSFVFAS